jgi:DNA-binding transcriptional MerR regulator
MGATTPPEERAQHPADRGRPAAAQGVYGISVAAEMVGMDPQSLRLYERRGLLQPDRTPGGTRRYSADDVARLGRIGELIDGGLNLAGVAAVLGLEADNAELAADNAELAADNARLRAELRR